MSRRSKGKTLRGAPLPQPSGLVHRQNGDAGDAKGQAAHRWLVMAVCVFLALAVWAVFGQTLRHEFVNYDDNIYVYGNPNVSRGLSLNGILWAFGHFDVDEWWPLTSISHMVDCKLFGLNPGGHHLTNILLHGATAILLFLVLRNMTGALWRSAFVAAVFAIHPLRVESVAWVTERKDVLSGLFFGLTLAAYVRYVRRPFAMGRYLLVLFSFALGLLSKATLVTMPFVLLLLDYWPLKRVSGVRWQLARADTVSSALTPGREPLALLLEKVPFLLLAAGACVTTVLSVNGIQSSDQISLPWRIGNALVSYAAYLVQMFFPAGLAVLYPHPENRLSIWLVVSSTLLLLLITVFVLVRRRTRPYLPVGWFWYLGMLVPVIGLVHVGSHARADRYTYLPQIGLSVLVAWGVADTFGLRRYRRAALGAASAVTLAVLMVLAHAQTGHWRDSTSLWTRTLACTSGNYVAHSNLGATLADQARLDEAISHYQQALQIKPAYAEAHYNLGVALTSLGRKSEAILHYERALRFKPDYADAHVNLGNALTAQGKLAEAIQHYEKAIQLNPSPAEAHFNLGNALTKQGRMDGALWHYERATQLKPDYAEAHYNLGNRLTAQGRTTEAIESYQRAIQINPDYAEAHNNLGNRLAAQQKWDQAARCYRQALQLKPDDAEAHNNLGVALVNQNRFEEAIACYEQALRIEPAYANAHANLGSAFVFRGETNKAIQHLQRALELATTQTNAALAEAVIKRLESSQFATPPTPAPQ